MNTLDDINLKVNILSALHGGFRQLDRGTSIFKDIISDKCGWSVSTYQRRTTIVNSNDAYKLTPSEEKIVIDTAKETLNILSIHIEKMRQYINMMEE